MSSTIGETLDIEKSHESFEHIYNTCWRYYRGLEHSLVETRRYVTFDKSNFSTFSLEYLRIILATCGEVDTVGKCLAQIADPDFKVKNANILKWRTAIRCAKPSHPVWADCPDEFSLPTEGTVVMLDEFIELNPWNDFVDKCNLDGGDASGCEYSELKKLRWWDDYTILRHHRISFAGGSVISDFDSANLRNALNSMAALYTLEKALLGAVGTVDDLEATIDDSELFAPRPRMATTSDIDSIFDSLE